MPAEEKRNVEDIPVGVGAARLVDSRRLRTIRNTQTRKASRQLVVTRC